MGNLEKKSFHCFLGNVLRNVYAKFQVDPLKTDVKSWNWKGVFPHGEFRRKISQESLGNVPWKIHTNFQVDPSKIYAVKSGELKGRDKSSASSWVRF